jgi:hypothetical protein
VRKSRFTDETYAVMLAEAVGSALFAEIKRHPLPPSPPAAMWNEPSNALWGITSTEIGAVAVQLVLNDLSRQRHRRRTPRALLAMSGWLQGKFARVFPLRPKITDWMVRP